ncbi:hypothetical protein PYW08_000539 [Mythimna loreyi]|uniref:Uncharacterized protein n=1 Tax=Mythimna loreyi TaxID=667449 RepID=A0ACC2RCR4_9NEOP|nr:hypothetical protein PYW08_000539 [Mythimna loreyi]
MYSLHFWYQLRHHLHERENRDESVLLSPGRLHERAVVPPAYRCDSVTESPRVRDDRYEKLKTELVRRLSASQERKVKQLLMHEELGDRKTSQFLRNLQGLAGPAVPEDFVRTIWSSRLPTSPSWHRSPTAP